MPPAQGPALARCAGVLRSSAASRFAVVPRLLYISARKGGRMREKQSGDGGEMDG